MNWEPECDVDEHGTGALGTTLQKGNTTNLSEQFPANLFYQQNISHIWEPQALSCSQTLGLKVYKASGQPEPARVS